MEEGRGVFDNLMKFITWMLPTNLAKGLVIMAAVFAGTLLPILPVQILWINMTTTVLLGITLAFEPKEVWIMQRSPRSPNTPLLNKPTIIRIFMVGVMLLIRAFALFEWAQAAGYSVEKARTVAGNVIVFGEIAFLFNCRSLRIPSWKMSLRTNPLLLAGVLAMISIQMLYTYLPCMNRLLGNDPIAPYAIIGVAVRVHIVM